MSDVFSLMFQVGVLRARRVAPAQSEYTAASSGYQREPVCIVPERCRRCRVEKRREEGEEARRQGRERRSNTEHGG